MIIQRSFNDTGTPETPEPIPENDHVCKMIQLPRHIPHVSPDTLFDVCDIHLEIKHESESILSLMEQHLSQ